MKNKRNWDDVPYGAQHIDPDVKHNDMFADFVLNTKERSWYVNTNTISCWC